MEPDQHKQRQDRRVALEDEITRLAGEMHAATYRFLTLIGELDRIGGWVGSGVRSCAHWLGWRCGTGLSAAREKVRVARALEDLPHVAEALRLGELSYSKARAVTRIANPDNERFLVRCALSGTAGQLERLVRYARKYGPEAAAEHAEQQHRERHLRVWTDDDGAVVIQGRLPPELGAVVIKALDAASDRAKQDAFEQAREAAAAAEASGSGDPSPGAEAEPPVSFRASRADALVDLAESFLASGYREGNAGERYQVVVHVDVGGHVAAASAPARTSAIASAIASGSPPAPANDDVPCCSGAAAPVQSGHDPAPYIEDVAVIADATAWQIACDASVVVMTEADGEPLDVGRRTRSIPPAIRRALERRDGGCVFPGCTSRRFVDGHHIEHWASGGKTALDNLVLLCRHHHRLTHTEGYTFQLKRGRVMVIGPDGSHIPRRFDLRVPRDGWDAIVRANREREIDIGPWTATPRWSGQPPDYNLTLSILGDIHRRAQRREERHPRRQHDGEAGQPGAAPGT